MSLMQSQIEDALHYMNALSAAIKSVPEGESWGGGVRLWLPDVIPLRPDYRGEKPVAWLVANDFEGYDLTMQEPKKEAPND
jgi:hypothetical protein